MHEVVVIVTATTYIFLYLVAMMVCPSWKKEETRSWRGKGGIKFTENIYNHSHFSQKWSSLDTLGISVLISTLKWICLCLFCLFLHSSYTPCFSGENALLCHTTAKNLIETVVKTFDQAFLLFLTLLVQLPHEKRNEWGEGHLFLKMSSDGNLVHYIVLNFVCSFKSVFDTSCISTKIWAHLYIDLLRINHKFFHKNQANHSLAGCLTDFSIYSWTQKSHVIWMGLEEKSMLGGNDRSQPIRFRSKAVDRKSLYFSQ